LATDYPFQARDNEEHREQEDESVAHRCIDKAHLVAA